MQSESHFVSAVLLLALSACDSPPAQIQTDSTRATLAAGIAASYVGGEISLAQIEAQFATARTPECVKAKSAPGGGSVDTLIPCYREVAEALAIEHIVLSQVPDIDQAQDDLDDDFDQQINSMLINAYNRQLAAEVEVTDEEIERYFADNKEDLASPRRFTLSNIFRRHRDPENAQETIAFLNRLKFRIEAGETFGAIAREHSDSETRLRDGLVGYLSEDKLPQRLHDIAVKLDAGEISEPMIVKGGAVLIKIDNIMPAMEPDLEAQRSAITQRLQGEKIHKAVDERIADRQAPADATLFSNGELLTQLDAEDTDLVIFNLGGHRLTIAEFRRLAGLEPTAAALDLPTDRQTDLLEYYAQLKRSRLLLIDLLQSDETADRELRKQIEQPLRKERLTRLVDQLLQEKMWQSVDQNPAALERFYEDNSHHYQSPLQFKLQVWNLSFDLEPAVQLEAMERARTALERGEYSLIEAVERLGGSVEDLGWREFADLSNLPAKARSYLLQTTPGGYSVPYQQDDALHIVWVEAQRAPQELAYESVQEQVRVDYFERFERRLYQDAVRQRLTTADFTFSVENVRQQLLSSVAAINR